jgi:putative aminopeptidase FrvX
MRNKVGISRMKIALAIVLAMLLTSVARSQEQAFQVTKESIKADVELHVCKDRDRLEAVKNLFKKLGASDEELKVEKFDGVENLTISKKGKTADTLIVGAHYDKVSSGCGAIDNWSGIVILANLYRRFRSIATEKTYIFAAFGKEEAGLVGAQAMAKSIPKENRLQYCAMVNFDSFGLHAPQVMTNVSNPRMTKFAKDVADEVKMPLHEAALEASADSAAFNGKNIPAITFHGLSSRWREYIHSSNDKIANVDYQSVLVGYNFGALFLNRLDAMPCGAFRK